MTQCPFCSSFNDGGASFCNQCGGALSRRRDRKSRALPKPPLLAGLALLLVGGGGAWVALNWRGPERPVPQRSSPPAASRPRVSSAGAREAAPAEEPGDPQPLAPAAIRRMVEAALARIELFDDRGETLREEIGVLLEEGAAVLCRFRPLLGAYR